jgi:hypothetical protein
MSRWPSCGGLDRGNIPLRLQLFQRQFELRAGAA